MGLNGGGYTFIQPADMERLTNEEVQTTFTDKSSFLLRIRRDDDAAQPYGIVKQMSTFKYVFHLINGSQPKGISKGFTVSGGI